MLVLALVACTEAPKPDVVGAVGDDWTVGETRACAAPVAAGWTLADEPVETYAPNQGDRVAIEPGAVGLLEGDEPWLVWTPPDAPVRARPLAGGEAREVSPRPASALALGDLDGDGRADLVLTGGLLEIVWAFGTAEEARAETFVGETLVHDAAVVDIDGDDLPDLVLGLTDPDHTDQEALRPRWMRNLGERAFADPELIAGDAAVWGPVFDLSVADIDRDGLPDVYLCNDFGGTVAPNALLHNTGGALQLAPARGLDLATSCMGVSWGDIAGDGTLAAYVAASAQHFLLTEDPGGWIDVATARGLPRFPSPRMPWGSALDDLDNDGRVDLLVGMSDFSGPGMAPVPLSFLRQEADGRFQEAGPEHGLPLEAHTRGVLTHDLDGDGVVELIVGDAQRSPWIWASNGCTADGWLLVEAPSGSRVTVEAGGRTFVALATPEPGWGATGPARAHFGLGPVEEIDAITIAAPWRAPETLDGPLAARRVVTWAP